LASHNWAGFYAGVNAGIGLSRVPMDTTGLNGPAGAVDISDAGFNSGVQAGFNWHMGPNWVVGIEGDVGRLGIDRSFTDFDNSNVFGVAADWYGTIRGRIGYSTGPALIYLTGGHAVVSVKNEATSGDFDVTTFQLSKSSVASGWTAGGGIEAALAENWTVKTEYLYVDVGGQDLLTVSVNNGSPTARFNNRFHAFRFGLNYRFGT
jgi:outer membrane immunogenic protein